VERREELDWMWAKVDEKEMEQDGAVTEVEVEGEAVVVEESEFPCKSVSFPLKDNLRAFMKDRVGR